MEKKIKYHIYQVSKRKCPKCKEIAESIGSLLNGKIIGYYGIKCSSCGFKKKAKLYNLELVNKTLF